MHDDINTKRTELANQMAAAGAALLDFTGTACAMAAIPDTEPQQYVAAGTPENIAAILPATISPARRMRHGERPTEPLQFDSPAATSGDAPDLQQLKALALAWTSVYGSWLSEGQIADGVTDEDAVNFIRDASPAVILGLIARIESGAASDDEDHWIDRLSYDAQVDEWAIERSNLEAEIESLRAAVSAATKPTACTLPPAGWSCTRTPSHEGPCAAVPTEVCADDYTPEQFSIYQHGVEDGKLIARGMERYKAGIAARDAATKPTADLSGLQRYGEVAEADGSGEYVTKAADGEFVKFCDVQSLLATKPAAAPAVPKSANFNMLRAMVEAGDKCNVYMDWRQAAAIYEAALAVTPAASTTGAAQTADQVRDQALEEAAQAFNPASAYNISEHYAQQRIRALKSSATQTTEGANNG